MTMWTLRSDDRLHEWKLFRSSLDALTFEQALQKTVSLWSFAPIVAHYLDRIDPACWPTPWELVSENNFDDIGKAVGMIYTLSLSSHRKNHSFQLLSASTNSGLENYNLVSIDEGKYILNFTFNEVISNSQIDTILTTTKIYTELDLKLSNY